ncbi:MAG: hypothetical protein ACRYFX_03995 [Janthinobacterium lividum]
MHIEASKMPRAARLRWPKRRARPAALPAQAELLFRYAEQTLATNYDTSELGCR